MAEYKPSEEFTPETMRRLGNLAKGIYNYYGEHWGPTMENYLNGMYDDPEALSNAVSIIRQMQEGPTQNNLVYNNRLPTKSAPYYTDPRVLYQGDGFSIQGPKTVYFDGSYVPDLAKWFKMVGSKDSFGKPSHGNNARKLRY